MNEKTGKETIKLPDETIESVAGGNRKEYVYRCPGCKSEHTFAFPSPGIYPCPFCGTQLVLNE